MTSFRVIRESESEKELRWKREQAEHHARYSNLRDTFHLPFPASAAEYVQRHGSRRNNHPLYDEKNKDSLSKLPPEVSDLILSKLSPAALVAARTTCRTWWTMIMGNRWILASVLGLKVSPAVRVDPRDGSNDAHLRRLQKELDSQMVKYSVDGHPDVWPLRFRQRVLNFSIPPICKHAHQEYSISGSEFISADFSTIGRFIVLLVTDLVEKAAVPQQTHNVVFYQMNLSNEPFYVGSLPCPKSNGPLSIIRGIEIQSYNSWGLTIDIGGTARSYSIVTREAYAKSDVPFIIEEHDPESAPFKVTTDSNLFNEPSYHFPRLRKSWRILMYLPYATGEGSGFVTKVALAKHVLSATLWVVRLGFSIETPALADNDHLIKDVQHQHVGVRDGREVVTALALIVPPKDKWIYRNVAVASSTVPTRVAVIWQENVGDHQHTELYFHDIPSVVFYRTEIEGPAAQRDTYLQRLTDPESAPPSEEPESTGLFVNVYGRRVRSSGWQMGGIHASSPVWDLPLAETSRYSLDAQRELGGLQIDSQKYIVWGPAESDVCSISFIFFDFAIASDTQLLSNRVRNGQDYLESRAEYHFTHCACSLHDDGYNIVLPDTACAALIAKTAPSPNEQPRTPTSTNKLTKKLDPCPPYKSEEYHLKEQILRKRSATLFSKNHLSFLPSLWTKPTPPTPAPGSIEHYDPPARKEALERRDEELREYIREWKREGRSDFDIAQAWFHSRWSGWGAIPKPEGWQNL